MRGPHPLDNPMWTALTTRQRSFAMGSGRARRYLPQVAPFAAVADPQVDADTELAPIIDAGESIFVVGVAPRWSAPWRVLDTGRILQMLCPRPIPPPSAPAGTGPVTLGAADRAAMLGLTALVYPEFFRERTAELGRYIGIRDGAVLAAMAGERLEIDGHVEVSAVCTHPGYAGRGYAARLLAVLANDIFARGAVPFLHVSDHNQRAIDLYRRLGFVERAGLDLWKLRREPAGGRHVA